MKFDVLTHAAILLGEDIYIDPFNLGEEDYTKAKIVFITHPHYDHCSYDDLQKIVTKDTILISVREVIDDLIKKGLKVNWHVVKPNCKYDIEGVKFETIRSYNISKKFHPKNSNWLGYIITLDKTRFAIVGDSDLTPELKKIKCDVLFVPIGGTYTMDAKQAAQLANILKPKITVPMHYNLLVGNKEDEAIFIEELDDNLGYQIHIE